MVDTHAEWLEICHCLASCALGDVARGTPVVVRRYPVVLQDRPSDDIIWNFGSMKHILEANDAVHAILQAAWGAPSRQDHRADAYDVGDLVSEGIGII